MSFLDPRFSGRPFATPGKLGLAAAALGLTLVATGCNRGGEDAETPQLAEPGAVAPGSGPAEPTPAAEGSAAAAPAPVAPRVEVQQPTRVRRDDVSENRELAARLGLAPPDPLLVSDLLTRADVRELTNFQGELLETSLEGISPDADYNAIRLQADGNYGFALQVWQHNEVRTLTAQFRRLSETYFDSDVDSAGVGNEAFSADFQGILHYAFLHRASKSIAIVSCQRGLCDPTQTRALAQRVANRL